MGDKHAWRIGQWVALQDGDDDDPSRSYLITHQKYQGISLDVTPEDIPDLAKLFELLRSFEDYQ